MSKSTNGALYKSIKKILLLYFVFDDIVECDWASQHDPHMADTAGSSLLHPPDSELKCRHQKTL